MRTHVLVLGGGYAGVMAANRLTRRDDVDVTLLNARPRFVERIRLHQLVADTYDPERDFSAVLADRVRVVVGEAAAIHAAARRVTLAGGEELAYDYLVYAVGSHASDGGVPGVAEHAYPVATLERAKRLRAALDADGETPVVVVGGGPTGVEIASELAEQGRDVTLVAGSALAPYFREPGRRSLRRQLVGLGVTVVEGAHVARVGADRVDLDDGTHVAARVTVWAAGFEPADLAWDSGLTTDHAGRLLADETLTSVDSDRIVGAGDAVAPSGVPERMSCQAAIPLGMQAAETVLARIAGAAPRPLETLFFGQCVSVGRHGAVAQLARSTDVAVPAFVGGGAAASAKEWVCRSTVSALAKEARKPGSVWAPPSRARRRVLAAAASHPGATAAPDPGSLVG